MILHVDLNSFFARAEQQANSRLRGQPIGVLGKGHKGARTCVVAASPEAKQPWGVKSGMSVGEAKRLCPQIILVPPDYPRYLDISRRFISILDRFSPWVEIFSIDEAFLALKRQYSEVSIQNSRETKRRHSVSCLLSPEYSSAFEVVQRIKEALRTELGALITASIGIAWGKVFAKLAGELEKPDGLVVLRPATWLERVGDLPVTELCGIGAQLEVSLAALKIRTINDLAAADGGVLAARFGPSLGMRLYGIGQGRDPSPVLPHGQLAAAKSIGHQVTLDRAQPFATLWPAIAKLTTKVGRRLRRAGLATNALGLHVSFTVFAHSPGHPRGVTSLTPGVKEEMRTPRLIKSGGWSERVRLGSATTDRELLQAAKRLVNQFPYHQTIPIIRIGVVAGDLTPHDGAQTLACFTREAADRRVTAALDALRDRYGDDAINWGSAHGVNLGNLRDWRGPRAVLDI